MGLIDKLRAARELRVEVDGRAYTIRRPTDAEAVSLRSETGIGLVNRFVVGWELREIDLVPGGSPVAVPFDGALWAEWVADQPQLWGPLSEAIISAYTDYRSAREDAVKN